MKKKKTVRDLTSLEDAVRRQPGISVRQLWSHASVSSEEFDRLLYLSRATGVVIISNGRLYARA